MGTQVEIGVSLGCSLAWIAFMRLAIVVTREVLPEPGIPPTAIMRRFVGGMERYFAAETKHQRALIKIYAW